MALELTSSAFQEGQPIPQQYTGDGKCRLPGSGYPKSVANIVRAERNIFDGSRTALQVFWQERAWRPGEEKRLDEPTRIVAER